MSQVTYKIAAMTDVGLVRTNNEDNLCVISNLDVEGSTWLNNEVCQLGSRGTLLVVADGMGGMNAGEVASEIAVSVVKQYFTEKIEDVNLDDNDSIVSFMNDSIVSADKAIKHEGRRRPDAKGMGTTIVIAWIIDNRLYVSWCGDSRAYLYNPNEGLFQISKDHSYVQELVDKGIVKPEDAFDFPESNVITRCLSHSSMKAVPDNLAAPIIISEGDIVLLCTDGLSGMIRDNEIASIIATHSGNLSDCVAELISAAKVAAGADNVTVCLCQILSIQQSKIGRTDTSEINLKDSEIKNGDTNEKPAQAVVNNTGNTRQNAKSKKKKNRLRKIVAVIITLLVLAGLILALNHFHILDINKKNTSDTVPHQSEAIDIMAESADSANLNNVDDANNATAKDTPLPKTGETATAQTSKPSPTPSPVLDGEPQKVEKKESSDSVMGVINDSVITKKKVRQRNSNIAKGNKTKK